MNIKYRDFLISNIIVVVFTILIVLIVNHFLIIEFGFDKESFVPITVFLISFGSILYYFLSKNLFDPLFRSDKNIRDMIKETLHELNTPVATIQMNSKMIQKKEENEKNIQRLKRIDESCENLLELYNQMEYNIKEQIDSINTEQFDISDIIEKSCKKFEDIKQDKELIYKKASLIVNADKNGFERIIDNLISNAIKYNKPNGKITISLKGTILSVKDTGIGIDTKSLFVIFDKYYQENSLNSGVGLGLNMVKAYCDKYKIQIKIDSTVDVGTTFYLDLKEVSI